MARPRPRRQQAGERQHRLRWLGEAGREEPARYGLHAVTDAARDVLTPKEVADRAGFSYHAILRAIRRGDLEAFEPVRGHTPGSRWTSMNAGCTLRHGVATATGARRGRAGGRLAQARLIEARSG
jgi:hypothetical protein